MKKLLFLLLWPALAFGQGYNVNENALGTDSLWLNYIGGTNTIIIHTASAGGVLVDQDPGAIAVFGVRNIDTMIVAVGGAGGYLTSGPTYDSPTDKITINGSFIVGSDGSLDGGASLHGRDAFTTTAQHDTVAITGASVNDNYWIQIYGATVPGATDITMTVEPTSTGFIIHRGAAGTSGLTYMWLRIR